MSINVLGTWQVLRLALELGHPRFVMTSTAQVTGVYYRQRDPDFLPLDDTHPSYPSTPYAHSKYLAEALCESVTRVYGMATVCLRPPLVLTEESLLRQRAAASDLREEDNREWNFGSWVHADDVAGAVLAALRCPDPGHAVLLLSAEDTLSVRPTRELLEAVYPGVPWRGADLAAADPHLALLDASGARRVLGWAPRRRFHE
jgi:nucleoside-diphosphate-sugar epimerase